MDKDRWIRQFNSIQQRREEHATRHEKLGTVHTKKKTSDKYEYEKTERRRNFIKKKKKKTKSTLKHIV